MSTWDTETDPDNPQPNVWPVCMEPDRKTGIECSTAYVWQQFMSLGRGYVWAWARSCKHKKAQPVLMTADGPYDPEAVKA